MHAAMRQLSGWWRARGASLWLLVTALALAGVLMAGLPRDAAAQQRPQPDRLDDTFRKYSKRYFGPGFDWRVFKAQGLAESNLDSAARSHVGARGVMQLMPSTYREICSRNPEITSTIDDPHGNIAAGISYDRRLWLQWQQDSVEYHRREFMFASYNAGRGTIIGAQRAARAAQLDARAWPNIETVAPRVRGWRYRETLGYVQKIDRHLAELDDKGRETGKPAGH
jgi:soluble lytic murein transglycosylase-like protein